MRGKAARHLVAVCAVVLGGLAAPHAWGAPVSPSPCTEIALSPAFSTDGTVVCAGIVYAAATQTATAAAVFVSTDKGHSWRKATAAGIAISRPDDYLRGVVLSPRYSSDHMVFVQFARAGLFASLDLGETFTLVSALGLGRVTAYVATPDVLAQVARPLLLHADAAGNDVSMQVDPTSHALAPVPGTPGDDREFAVSPRYATDNLAFAAGMVASADGTYLMPTVFACSAGFACTEQRFRGPARATFDRLWMLPSAAPSGFVVVLRLLVGSTPKLWRSTDGGRTFQSWTSVNTIGATIASGGSSHLDVAADPTQPKRMYLRASWSGNRNNLPNEQLYVSDDAGTHWRRVSYGSMVSLRHVGPIPEMDPTTSRETPAGFVAAGGGGRLFMLAGDRYSPAYVGPYCSRDGGKTWARFC
jgi:hypothetical protein